MHNLFYYLPIYVFPSPFLNVSFSHLHKTYTIKTLWKLFRFTPQPISLFTYTYSPAFHWHYLTYRRRFVQYVEVQCSLSEVQCSLSVPVNTVRKRTTK